MTASIPVEGIRREVLILQSLTGHPNLAEFYGAFEDGDNVYIVMELCNGGGLLERMLARGGRYAEDDAKAIIIQILNAVAFLHLHGLVHSDLQPESFLFNSKDNDSQLKAIDFGLSDFVKPDINLIGSAYYVAPEVVHRSYDTPADLWSVGVITYILLCGSQPFWDQTESSTLRAALEGNPTFEEPWLSLAPESKDFVRCLLRPNPSQRISAAQALCHPWLQKHVKIKVPLDILIFRHMKSYMQSSYLRKAALKALSKTLTADELYYLKQQYAQMYPDERGGITYETIKMGLAKNAPGAQKHHIADLLEPLNALQYRRMHFEEFCAAALSVSQLKALDNWGDRTRRANDIFEQNGNRAIAIEELASELGISSSTTVHDVLQEWVRQGDGKLTFRGFVKLLSGQSTNAVYKDSSQEFKNGQLRLQNSGNTVLYDKSMNLEGEIRNRKIIPSRGELTSTTVRRSSQLVIVRSSRKNSPQFLFSNADSNVIMVLQIPQLRSYRLEHSRHAKFISKQVNIDKYFRAFTTLSFLVIQLGSSK
ncbi:CDPK-related protein kinase-like isoform X2 [Andrographis paniculata]|nr:CDPK-related protein kinase-like isoform X2 [Andrographis paniculata]